MLEMSKSTNDELLLSRKRVGSKMLMLLSKGVGSNMLLLSTRVGSKVLLLNI